ncbi:hypothetical protein [Streptomyces griseosporeus]|uniref:hypothetical protein n=1 Tax=Streptomyces griseosporeus TaxID=1910 RepID=UPI0036FBD549
MSHTEELLAQIDAAVNDWTVSGDAMRCRPTAEPSPVPAVPVVRFTGRDRARAALVSRLVDRGLEPAAAHAAVRAAENGEPTEHAQLVAAEARAAVGETVQQLGEVMRAFARALHPIAEAAAAVMRQLDEALRSASHTTGRGRHRDRPAWQSPYGPPARRKR